jgi:hypothetical protein
MGAKTLYMLFSDSTWRRHHGNGIDYWTLITPARSCSHCLNILASNTSTIAFHETPVMYCYLRRCSPYITEIQSKSQDPFSRNSPLRSWDPSKGPLFLGIESLHSPVINLWWIKSWILNLNKTHHRWGENEAHIHTFLHTNGSQMLFLRIEGGWKRWNLWTPRIDSSNITIPSRIYYIFEFTCGQNV